jgi:hypothetical protein
MRWNGDILPVPGARHVCDGTFGLFEAIGSVATLDVECEVESRIQSVGRLSF